METGTVQCDTLLTVWIDEGALAMHLALLDLARVDKALTRVGGATDHRVPFVPPKRSPARRHLACACLLHADYVIASRRDRRLPIPLLLGLPLENRPAVQKR